MECRPQAVVFLQTDAVHTLQVLSTLAAEWALGGLILVEKAASPLDSKSETTTCAAYNNRLIVALVF